MVLSQFCEQLTTTEIIMELIDLQYGMYRRSLRD